MIEFEGFLEYYERVKNVSADTVKAYRSDLKLFGTFLTEEGVTRATQIDHQLINRYIERMKATPSRRSGGAGLSDATIARRLAAVSSFLDYVRVNKHHNLRNPVTDFTRRWKRNNRPKPVGHDVIDQLLKSITDIRDRVLIEFFLASGLRLSEVSQLNRDSVKIEEFAATAKEPKMVVGTGEVLGKGGKIRTFHVHSKPLISLMRYITGRKDEHPAMFISERKQRMSARAMQERLAHWCKVAGVSHTNVHRLRHTYATRLINAGMDVLHLKELMGHSSLATTLQYAKIADTTLARGYHAAMEFVDL